MLFSRRRARNDHAAATRVLNHAALTKFRGTPADRIPFLAALEHWHDTFVADPTDEAFRRADEARPAFATAPDIRARELPDQTAMVEAVKAGK